MILENLQDPGNLGTILRTAEGAGVDGVILSRTSVDIYNPKTIRATMGSIYRMPFLYADQLEEILPELMRHICREKIVTTKKIIKRELHSLSAMRAMDSRRA